MSTDSLRRNALSLFSFPSLKAIWIISGNLYFFQFLFVKVLSCSTRAMMSPFLPLSTIRNPTQILAWPGIIQPIKHLPSAFRNFPPISNTFCPVPGDNCAVDRTISIMRWNWVVFVLTTFCRHLSSSQLELSFYTFSLPRNILCCFWHKIYRLFIFAASTNSHLPN